MARFEDLKEMKNERAVVNAIRERLAKFIFDKSKEEFGEDFTRYIPKDIGITRNASKVAKHTVVIDVGDIEDKDGCPVGVCAEITVKVKKWNTTVTKSDNTVYGITLDEYDEVLTKLEDKGD